MGGWRKRGQKQRRGEQGGKKKRGAQERERAKAFKRLLVTKLTGSFIPCFCSFTRSLYTLSLCTSFCPEWGGEGAEKEVQRKVNSLVSITTQVY